MTGQMEPGVLVLAAPVYGIHVPGALVPAQEIGAPVPAQVPDGPVPAEVPVEQCMVPAWCVEAQQWCRAPCDK